MPIKLFANHLGDRFEIPIEMIRFSAGELQHVFKDGQMVRVESFETIRRRLHGAPA